MFSKKKLIGGLIAIVIVIVGVFIYRYFVARVSDSSNDRSISSDQHLNESFLLNAQPGLTPVVDRLHMGLVDQGQPAPSLGYAFSGSSFRSSSATQFVVTSTNAFDTDHDGLTDEQEKTMYKTDPKKADSDGDGYPDGEEVKKGYNPRGSGRCSHPSCLP